MVQAWVARVCVVVLFVAASGCASVRTSPGSDTGRSVVVISLDGLAAYYLDDPQADMPTLRRLAQQGARASSMRPSTPTVTWPNHATLMTGVHPAHHGVVGNNYVDRATGKRVQLIADPDLDKHQLVKVPTIYDVAHDAGMTTAAIRWPASRNAKTLTWQMPDVGSVELWRKYSTPEFLAEVERAGIHPDEVRNPTEKATLTSADWRDELWTKAFNLLLREHRPRLAMLHLANVDHVQHLHGPRSDEAYAAINVADRQVQDVWDQMKRVYGDKAALVIVSDHGFSPVRKMVFPNVILREAGLVDVKGVRVVGGGVTVMGQGGAAFVYIDAAADRPDVMQSVIDALANVEGIARVAGPEELQAIGVADPKDDPHAPDMIIFSKMGYIFGDTAAGALAFNEKPERKGSHGHDAAYPELHATFIASGDGVRPGTRLGEISNTDVAPTVAHLLGLEMKNADGRALNLASPKP